MKKITQKEIAEKLGLNVRTISRVLSHSELVKPETRQKVVQELNNHGYFFKNHARSEVIAIDIATGYLEKNALQLIEMLSNYDFHFVMTNHKNNLRHFYKTIANADVVVFCSTPNSQIIKDVLQHNPNIYRINLFSHGIPGAEVSIEPDNDLLAKRSAKYLLSNNHLNILVISSKESVSVLERTKSFIGEISVTNPKCKIDILYEKLDFSMKEKIKEKLQSNTINKPTAIYCPGLYIAFHATCALAELGIKVPDEISILINDLPEEFSYELPFKPDTIYSKISDVIELAQFHIINRFMLKSANSFIASSGSQLQVNGTVKKLKDKE